jgi:hypothetical protein
MFCAPDVTRISHFSTLDALAPRPSERPAFARAPTLDLEMVRALHAPLSAGAAAVDTPVIVTHALLRSNMVV